jgi:hypothetical protein
MVLCRAGSGKLDAEIANAISSPAIITCQAKDQSLGDLKRKILLKKALLDDHKVRTLLLASIALQHTFS